MSSSGNLLECLLATLADLPQYVVYTVQCDNGQSWHWITQQFNFSNVAQNSGFELFVVGRGGIVVEILHSR